jgi:hypothetical protein
VAPKSTTSTTGDLGPGLSAYRIAEICTDLQEEDFFSERDEEKECQRERRTPLVATLRKGPSQIELRTPRPGISEQSAGNEIQNNSISAGYMNVSAFNTLCLHSTKTQNSLKIDNGAGKALSHPAGEKLGASGGKAGSFLKVPIRNLRERLTLFRSTTEDNVCAHLIERASREEGVSWNIKRIEK